MKTYLGKSAPTTTKMNHTFQNLTKHFGRKTWVGNFVRPIWKPYLEIANLNGQSRTPKFERLEFLWTAGGDVGVDPVVDGLQADGARGSGHGREARREPVSVLVLRGVVHWDSDNGIENEHTQKQIYWILQKIQNMGRIMTKIELKSRN